MITSTRLTPDGWDVTGARLVCGSCGFAGPVARDSAEALALWNAREAVTHGA